MHKARPHPLFPFIVIGKYFDPDLQGIQNNQSHVKHDYGWCFTINHIYGHGTYRTKKEAVYAAEKELFNDHGEFVQSLLQIALEEGNIHLALALAECRGYWLGATHCQKETAFLIKETLKKLIPLAKF